MVNERLIHPINFTKLKLVHILTRCQANVSDNKLCSLKFSPIVMILELPQGSTKWCLNSIYDIRYFCLHNDKLDIYLQESL